MDSMIKTYDCLRAEQQRGFGLPCDRYAGRIYSTSSNGACRYAQPERRRVLHRVQCNRGEDRRLAKIFFRSTAVKISVRGLDTQIALSSYVVSIANSGHINDGPSRTSMRVEFTTVDPPEGAARLASVHILANNTNILQVAPIKEFRDVGKFQLGIAMASGLPATNRSSGKGLLGCLQFCALLLSCVAEPVLAQPAPYPTDRIQAGAEQFRARVEAAARALDSNPSSRTFLNNNGRRQSNSWPAICSLRSSTK
jgi:hypothetical protein